MASGGVGGCGKGEGLVQSTCQMRRSLSQSRPLLSLSALFGLCFYFPVYACVSLLLPWDLSALTSPACRPPCLSPADTRYSVEDIEGALLKQMKASKDTGIAVKKPEEQNIRFTNYGNSDDDLAGGIVPGISRMKGDFLSYS